MIYKNIEFHNVAEIIPDDNDGGVTWLRMPGYLTDKFEMPLAKEMNAYATGVEMRFVIKSGSAVIRMKALSENCCFHIFRGGIQAGWTDNGINTLSESEEKNIVVEKSDNLEMLRLMAKEAGDAFDPEVIRIIFDKGYFKILDISGDIEPPKKGQTPEKTILCYGSSLTHGSNSLNMSQTWAALAAKALHTDLLNYGMAGSCAVEHETVDYIASSGENGCWDTALLELGANVLSWDEKKIRERTGYTVKTVAEKNPDKQIYIISPFYCGADLKNDPRPGNWRRILKETVSQLGFKNVTYICGTDLLDKISLISADEVHPNIYGIAVIAERITQILKK